MANQSFYDKKDVPQSQEIKNKKIETCRKHWGVDYPFQSDEVRSKTALKRLEATYVHLKGES